MSLAESLEQIANHLRLGRFPNEQAVSQGVVLRILNELGWDTYNPEIVWPEYSLGGRRVDFALCFPPRKPSVFIEVKQPGKGDGADQQLFEYAFHEGVPMAVLTDGKTWSFYLPAEQGNFEERRVYKLDLIERNYHESTEKLIKYLAYDRIVNGQAIEEARKDYRDRNRRQLAQQSIPEAWKELVESEDPSLFDRLSSEVESKCGVKPDLDDVKSFLDSFNPGQAPSLSSSVVHHHYEPGPAIIRQTGHGLHQFTLRGQNRMCRNAKEVMVEVLRMFANADPEFAKRCANDPENLGRSRTYISNDPSELYPNAPHLAENHEHFHPDWVVATNLSNDAKQKVLKMACRVAGLAWGTDLKVDF